jgi:regulator of protease activity HflC (stomatin/prohibitin superfamily)
MFFRFIPTATTGIRQTFGRFSGLCKPGLNVYIPFFQSITPVSNQIMNKNFQMRVKTRDNVFTDLHIGVQLQIKAEDTERAFFSLDNPDEQVDTYVQNVVRSRVPGMKLDELFESQGDIGSAVRTELDEKMGGYGYTIVDTLVNDISPDPEVMKAMNAINASERMKDAAKNEAEAGYIRKVREAEADRDRKILQGEGISGQRLAILKGLQEGVESMSVSLNMTPTEVSEFVLRIQNMDMMEMIGTSNNAKTIFMNSDSSPSNGSGDSDSIRRAMMEALDGVREE